MSDQEKVAVGQKINGQVERIRITNESQLDDQIVSQQLMLGYSGLVSTLVLPGIEDIIEEAQGQDLTDIQIITQAKTQYSQAKAQFLLLMNQDQGLLRQRPEVQSQVRSAVEAVFNNYEEALFTNEDNLGLFQANVRFAKDLENNFDLTLNETSPLVAFYARNGVTDAVKEAFANARLNPETMGTMSLQMRDMVNSPRLGGGESAASMMVLDKEFYTRALTPQEIEGMSEPAAKHGAAFGKKAFEDTA